MADPINDDLVGRAILQLDRVGDAIDDLAAEQRAHGRKMRQLLMSWSAIMLVGASAFLWVSLS